MNETLIDQAGALTALSPLDGRYAGETAPLRDYFSEWALVRDRLRVEIAYLLALSQDAHLVRPLSAAEANLLRALAANFSPDQAGRVKEIEREIRHDVKALEYYLREAVAATPLADLLEWLHFGLTSEDVTLTAQALALRDSRDAALLPALDALVERLAALAGEYKGLPMLARTHGQPAVPTTLGKELAVFVARLQTARAEIAAHRFEAKLTGAVGNFNALVAAAPQVDWLAFSARFVESLGLQPNLATTQLVPYDNWIRYFDALRRANGILLDLAQDMWRYISDDYLVLRVVAGEVGSSTMPQKVNPIDFENAEGNLGLANALFTHYAQKLAVSRLQRDLSDSTVRRNFGVALGHTLLAFLNIRRGLDRVQANEGQLHADLDAHWEVVAEGVQTILRAAGVPNAYDQVKALTRGKTFSRAEFEQWIDRLAVEEAIKTRLRALTPFSYVGLAEQIAKQVISG
ncbi:MAG: adenylosuccinate lyase [Anaerolineae bacterium]